MNIKHSIRRGACELLLHLEELFGSFHDRNGKRLKDLLTVSLWLGSLRMFGLSGVNSPLIISYHEEESTDGLDLTS